MAKRSAYKFPSLRPIVGISRANMKARDHTCHDYLRRLKELAAETQFITNVRIDLPVWAMFKRIKTLRGFRTHSMGLNHCILIANAYYSGELLPPDIQYQADEASAQGSVAHSYSSKPAEITDSAHGQADLHPRKRGRRKAPSASQHAPEAHETGPLFLTPEENAMAMLLI
jgi:hypothetical protein